MEQERVQPSLLIPRPKRGLGGHLVTFLAVAFLLHGLAYAWLLKYGTATLRKTGSLIGIKMYKEPPPPPKPKVKPPPPPPKPKVVPKSQPQPKASAPVLKLEQTKFHQSRKAASEESNLQEVEETKGGSKFGNPEGTPGGKGGMQDVGTSKAPPPPPPPKPKPLVPDRKDPLVVSRCQPPYPDMERDQGIEGTVQLVVLVGRQGQILEARVSQSSGNSSLDSAAIQNVRECWRFAPAIQNGEPVEARITFQVVFRLQ